MKEMTLKEIQEQLGYEIKIVAEQEQKSKVWKPKKGETYWYVDYDGTVCHSEWGNLNVEKSLYALGNCFRTREEAEFFKEKLLVTAELQRFADEHNDPINWENIHQFKYRLYYDHLAKKLYDIQTDTKSVGVIVFTSLSILRQAIETIGEDRIKKYYLGVTE